MDQLTFHDMQITWLDGGVVSFDGGAIFGVVPKPLWSRKYPVNEQNQIENATDPILIQYQGKNYLIDKGINKGKLTEKQKKIFGVYEESSVVESLSEMGLTPADIDYVCMTHMHFDHASGLTTFQDGRIQSTFPHAVIHMSQAEWDEVRNPNIRSKSTYWKENWEAIQDQVHPFETKLVVADGVEMVHTGGHSNGHSVIKLQQRGEMMIHLADLFALHAHQNPLWVMAYDDYPMDSIFAKQKWLEEAYQNGSRFIFYHDVFYRMIQWDRDGKEIIDCLKRSKKPYIKMKSTE